MNVLLYHLLCARLQSSICASWQEGMGSQAVVASFPSKADRKGHGKQPCMPQEDQHPGGRSWYRHTGGAPGELAMISWMLVLSSRRMPDQNLGCTYSLFTNVPTACAQPWANDITLHLGFLVSQGKVNNSCHVLWSSLICVQERHDVSCGICSARWWHSALCQTKWELQSYFYKHQREWRVWSRSQSRQFQQMLKTEDSGE